MLFAGKMKGIAFIKDPDDYWIEIFDLQTIGKITLGAAWGYGTLSSGYFLVFLLLSIGYKFLEFFFFHQNLFSKSLASQPTRLPYSIVNAYACIGELYCSDVGYHKVGVALIMVSYRWLKWASIDCSGMHEVV